MLKNNKGIIQKIRRSRTFRGTCALLVLSLVFEIAQPTVSLALTEGPSQPEVQSFEPINTTQMVDLFTGDFNYNIPLFNLPGPNGGYPVNLAYHAGATMDDEASWVGLGWNINAGSLVRNVRGLPDEFMSKPDVQDPDNADEAYDYLEVQSDMKQSWTLGVNGGLYPELFGANIDNGDYYNLSASIYYNNYNGLGVSLDPSVSIGNHRGNVTFGLSLDSENGLGVNASIGLYTGNGNERTAHTLGLDFDGNLSVNYSISKHKRGADIIIQAPRPDLKSTSFSGDLATKRVYSSGFNFARANFAPNTGMAMRNYNLSLSFKTGVSGFGYFHAGSIGLFYNTQDISDKEKNGRKHFVVGYASSGAGTTNDGDFTRDFVRMNDGQITKSSMFLPHSYYAYDTYSSTGQGLSGSFRTRRSDIGRSHDPHVFNGTYGLSGSLDMAPVNGQPHTGIGIGANFGFNSQGPWNELNDLQYDFYDSSSSGIEEITYYQAHGEQTILHPDELDYMRGLDLPFVRLKPKSEDDLTGGKRRIDGSTSSVPNNEYSAKRTPNERVVRNTLIHDLHNDEVEHIGEFDIRYFTSASQVYGVPSAALDRETRNAVNIGKHPAGYKVLNNEGSYYVYGLPCYNQKEVENLYSVGGVSDPSNTELVNTETTFDYKASGTHKFIHKTTKSPYAHSYMLTSVQGADYIDLTNNGPSDDDMGYWVKFNYLKQASNYKWRAPYVNNAFSSGQLWTAQDDKASYQYGEKEMWYLGQIETKTHIAVFVMEQRSDMKEAAKEYEGNDQSTQRAMKLASIKVYDKKSFQADPSVAPLQTVVFNYEQGVKELCKGAPNADNGKLTLKSVHFLSNGSTRGEQNKYEFDYTNESNAYVDYDNPDYATNSYDSWTNYRPKGTQYEYHSRFPYVNQFNQDWGSGVWEPGYGTNAENSEVKKITKGYQDAKVSAWCLKKITLPSGGTIRIQYESDDYGYVQHKTANQMFKIHKMGEDNDLADNQLYTNSFGDNSFSNTSSFDDEKRRRIFFKLEYPIPTTTSVASASEKVYNEYVKPIIQDENGQRNLYFRTKMKLTKQGVYDYVSGYLPLEETRDAGNGNYNYGVHTGLVSDGYYTHGYVTVQPAKRKNGNDFHEYHPMALAGWTYLQTNAQMILNNSTSIGADDIGLGSSPTINDLVNQLNALGSMVPTAAANFGAIRPYCKSQNMAQYIDLNYSCIRLASPDKIKFGGGHRVKEISISDNWASDTGTETDRTYGQRFEYTMEENGKIISSGVAQYEPQAGGDENPLKYPIYYFDKQNLVSKNNLFAEAPMNEALFPGASVGYRKVTVKSLNSDKQMRNHSDGDAGTTALGRTGGVTVHEFYTAKEFPTIVSYSLLSEENSTKDVFNLPITIPLIGSIKRNYYHGTQAYMIELNDMHGKPKSVESFELNNYAINPNAITSTSYEYQYDVINYQGETVKKLNNYVSVIENNGTHSVNSQTKRLMGVETDLFTDQRQSKTFNTSAGVDFNIDVPFIPWLSFWPTYTNHKSMFRTYVTNKVIHRTGIVKKVKSRDLQTVNESEILAYDEKSGIPLLTRVKNEFGDDFYNYNVPAYYAYDRMGHAYRNINYTFTTPLSYSVAPSGESGSAYLEFDGAAHLNYLVRGDELLILDAANDASDQYKKVYFLGWKYDGGVTKGILHSPFGNIMDVSSNFKLKVIRSGRRNNFGATIANYLTKGRPEDDFKKLANGNIDYKNVDLADATIQVPQFKANTVLSATAAIFRDDWSTSVQTDLYSDLVTENPFLTGNSGIWRPHKSYTYVGPRKSTANMNNNTGANPALYDDGVFEDEIKLFTWDLGNIEDYVSNWEWVNEITRYSPDAYELENRNRLGIYSSALYGYDNNLSIGVSGNSEYHETGVMDFEKSGGIDGSPFAKLLAQTNLNFDNNHTASTNNIVTVQVDFKKATVSGKDLVLLPADNASIPSTYFTQDFNGQFVGLSITSRKTSGLLGNMGFYFNGLIKSKGQTGNLVIEPFLRRDVSEKLVQDGGVYHGVITFFLKRRLERITEPTNVQYVTSKAHTGKKCMSLLADVVFDQPRIRLVSDKTYVLSLWISRRDENVVTYKPTTGQLVEIGKMNSGAFASLPTTPIVKYGKIVEGWQKIDVEFKWDAANGDAVPAIRFTPGLTLYVDDIRISPKTGGLVTYVFDTVKYWLTASLNVDNYATLYYYDEEGNLHLKKQETEKGIFTVTESRGHVSKQP